MEKRTAYVGIDLVKEQVAVISVSPDYSREAYTLVGTHEGEGVIALQPDDTFNGRRALAIALAETEGDNRIGLGWKFTVTETISAENHNLSQAW